MRVRGVLFDFGYTLFAHAPLAITLGDCARRLGNGLSDEQAADLAHRIEVEAMSPRELAHRRDFDSVVWAERWSVLYGIADALVDGLGAEVFSSMHDPLEWIPYRESASTLQSLHAAGVPVGIISNTGWDVRSAFSAHSMSSSVTSFTLSYEAGLVKPDPQIFALACAGLGLAPSDVLMVGDDPRSDGSAVAAGIRTLLLPPLPPGSDNGVGAILSLLTGS